MSYQYATAQSIRWWPHPDGDDEGGPLEDDEGQSTRHERLVPAVWLVWTRNAARRQQSLYYARLYGGLEQASATSLGIDPAAQVFEPASLPYNVIRSGTNTLTAKVAKNRPVPMYLPVGGNHRIHKRVKLLNRFVPGLFHKHKIHKCTRIMTRDAGLYGTGLMLIQPDRQRVAHEKLFVWETYVDPVDARYGEPRSLYLVRYLDKDVLLTRYPEHADAIDTAPALDEAFFPIQDVFAVANRCTVIEAWHLPSDPGRSRDGRHTVCLLDETLLDEPYDFADYPVAHIHKDAPLSGWWGMGLGDEMGGFQDEINIMAERVQIAHRVVGGQIWLVPEGSGMLDTDFNDDIGVVIRHTPGLPPTPVNPQPLHEQTYQYFRDLPPMAYGFSGISQMSAQAQKPAGVTAALALQTLDDIETDRFSLFESEHEELHVDIARLQLRAVRQIADKYGDFRVFTALGKTKAAEILWKRDIDLDEDSYVVQAWPTSLLPKTPAAKLQRVIELSTNPQGSPIFDRQTALKLMNLPDTTTEEQLILAAQSIADAQIATMLECDDPHEPMAYQPPEKYQDLEYSKARAQAHYNLLRTDATDNGNIEDGEILARLRLLQDYMDACQSQIDDAQAAQLQAAAAAQAAQTPPAAPPAATPPQQMPNTPANGAALPPMS